MVTGVETAGLILGSIPLLIEGLKVYQKGVKSVKRSVKYDISLRKLIRRIDGQKLFFEDNLQKLLQGANSVSTHPIDIDDDLWTGLLSVAANQVVKDYLGDRKQQYFYDLLDEFECYFFRLANILDGVQRTAKSNTGKKPLALSDLYTLAQSHSTQGKHISKRVLYLIKEEDIIELIEELDARNSDMDRLLANANILAQQKSIQKSRVISNEPQARAMASLLNQIRAYTERLFDAFCSAWTPGCHSSHDVALFLDSPIVPKLSYPKSKSSFQFRIMIRGRPRDPEMAASWHEANVTVFEDSGSVGQQSISPPVQIVTVKNPVTPKIKVTVLDPTSTSATTSTRITDLCNAAVRAQHNRIYLELLIHHGASLVSDGTRNQKHESATWSTIDLEKFLHTNRMGPAQKVKLALKLAVSIIQFKPYQWLEPSVSAHVVHFREDSSQAGKRPRIEVEQPLILQSFQDQTPAKLSSCKPRQMLLELGILLMEIWNGETIATFAKRSHDLDDISPLMRQGVAIEWYDDTQDQMTNNYGGVVNTCIAFALDHGRGTQNWEDEDLRKAVCSKIISPLVEECLVFP